MLSLIYLLDHHSISHFSRKKALKFNLENFQKLETTILYIEMVESKSSLVRIPREEVQCSSAPSIFILMLSWSANKKLSIDQI
jgi:hypothetical protein